MREDITVTEQIFKLNLKRLRKEHGYSKYKVAHMLGIAYSYYHKLEDDEMKVTPSFEIIEKISNIYGINVSELMKIET